VLQAVDENITTSKNVRPPTKVPPSPQGGKKGAFRTLLSKLFKVSPDAKSTLSRLHKSVGLGELDGQQQSQRQIRTLGEVKNVTDTLYWYTVDMSFRKSDFQRILPPPDARVQKYPPELDTINFERTCEYLATL
jgi:hypothetical protein